VLEAKKIADLAKTYYIPAPTHNVAGPVATVASANGLPPSANLPALNADGEVAMVTMQYWTMVFL